MKQESISQELSTAARSAIRDVAFFSEIDSTSSEVLRRYQQGLQDGCLVVAAAQSSGRGRRGREWASPMAGGLYMSIGLPFENSARELQALSLVTGLSVVAAIEDVLGLKLSLKWPNDVLAENKKLAGILLERHIGQVHSFLVFGIGVNIKIPSSVKEKVGRPLTDLCSLVEGAVDEGRLAGNITNELVDSIALFLQEGFKPFQDRWNAADRYVGADIVIENAGIKTIGKSLGVDEAGNLILSTATGQRTITTGEIFPSLRLAED